MLCTGTLPDSLSAAAPATDHLVRKVAAAAYIDDNIATTGGAVLAETSSMPMTGAIAARCASTSKPCKPDSSRPPHAHEHAQLKQRAPKRALKP